jgi:hypothetical protein
MRRVAVAALLAVGLALTAGGCGVQPTGVNVAQTAPFSNSQASSSQSASRHVPTYPVQLFLYPATSGTPREVTRYIDSPPTSVIDLAYQLRDAAQAQAEGYTTWVPPDLVLEPTSRAHEYRVLSDSKVLPSALYQLVCTFDQYWQQHPSDGQNASTQFLYPNNFPNGWQDCLDLLPSTAPSKAAARTPPTGPTAVLPTGN